MIPVYEAYEIALVPVVVGLVYVFRVAGVPARFLPLLSVLIGGVLGFVFVSQGDPRRGILAGIVIGLSAIGAWSGIRNTFKM